MLGLPLPLLPPPWFWSDQYSDNLQFIGDMRGDDWLCRGNPETEKAIWFNLQNGVLIGAVTLNQGARFAQFANGSRAAKRLMRNC
ncbi:oxidoreductase C-terminal domain-containing protein [Escherichia coli]